MTQMYLVGGAVRDMMLGENPKDYDFTVEAESFESMQDWLMRELSAEIFLTKPEYGTIRAAIPSTILEPLGHNNSRHKTVAADFVLARKDGYYSDGRRPDSVEMGDLADDLARRDFTMNAMALTMDGELIDPFNGHKDIREGRIRAVGSPTARLSEDALRAVRAIRFAVTKGMAIDFDLGGALKHAEVLYNLEYKISDERIREELHKAFRHDTMLTIYLLEQYRLMRAVLFGHSRHQKLWLKPTLEAR